MSSQFEKAVAYVQGLDKEGSGPDATVKLEASHHYVEDRRRAILIDTLIHSFINSTSKVLVLSLWKNLNWHSSAIKATVGDADPAKEPSMFQFVERAKWWAETTPDKLSWPVSQDCLEWYQGNIEERCGGEIRETAYQSS
jgi:acyl-CoA-binding protein